MPKHIDLKVEFPKLMKRVEALEKYVFSPPIEDLPQKKTKSKQKTKTKKK